MVTLRSNPDGDAADAVIGDPPSSGVVSGPTIMRGKLRRNVAVTMATQLTSWGLAVGVTFFLPGYLGEKSFGILTLSVAFAATLGAFISFGTSTVLVQQVARTPHRARELVRTSLRLRSAIGASLFVLGMLGTWVLGYPPEIRNLIALLLAAQVLGQVMETYQSALSGLEAFMHQSSAALAEKLSFSVVTIALVLLKAPLWNFAAVYLLGSCVSALVAGRAFKRVAASLPPAPKEVPQAEVIALAKSGVPFLTMKFFAVIYGDGSSAVLMSKLSTLQSIGWFGLAKRYSGAALMVPVSIATALLPRLTRIHHEGDRRAFARLAWQTIGVTFAAALPVAFVLVFLPRQLMTFLRYPAGFAGAVPVLQLSGCVLFLWFVQQAVAMAVIAAGKQKWFAIVTGTAAVIAFPVTGACIWAGERYLKNGAVGAMAGDAILEFVMLVLYFRALIPDLFPGRQAAAVA